MPNPHELSPYYAKLYQQVAQLPEMVAVRDRIVQAFANAKLTRHSYKKTDYGHKIVAYGRIRLGNKLCDVDFRIRGDDDPSIRLETEHLVDGSEILDVYFDNVGREGKPIRPHGLVKEETVRNGAEPRKKNALVPWMKYELLHSKEVESARICAQQRIGRKILALLKDSPVFIRFAENLTFEHIVAQLGEFTFLPPEVLHRAIDMMYVKTTMET